MNCEQALNLISARLDRELANADREVLDVHLRDCSACRATADAFVRQDVDLRRAFSRRRDAALQVEERVIARLRLGPTFRWRRPVWLPWALVAAGGMAAMLAGVAFLWSLRFGEEHAAVTLLPGSTLPPMIKGPPGGGGSPEPLASVGLTPRPRPPSPELIPLAVGDHIGTRPGERLRVALPDGSILYVNQSTAVRVEAQRRLALSLGEIFVEEAPFAEARAEALRIHTAQEEITSLSAKLAVTATAAGTGVLVAQGKAWLGGLNTTVLAGQRVSPGAKEVSSAPRASHAIAWTRDLMAAAESPLVPGSKFAGGALVAIDPYGQEARLKLRKYHVDVHIEDGFARTTIDQTYFNEAPSRLEGTFYFPLPADASLSRLAMYVDGNLMEGGMAEREHARRVYETILRTQRDPALLEWVDGSTFKMRVFPLEGRQEKRIVLSYVQRLPVLYGQTTYRFPTGHSLDVVRHWSFHARVKNGALLTARSSSHPEMKVAAQGTDLVLDAAAQGVKLDRDVTLELLDKSETDSESLARFSTAEHEGARYLMMRYRPKLAVQSERQRRDWVFLFEASADRDPLLARTQVDIVRGLLAQAEPEDQFAVLTAGARVHELAPQLQAVTPQSVQAAVQFLERTHLVGALDLGQAFETAAKFLAVGTNSHLVHLGGGIPALGDRREEALFKRLPNGTRYVGVGVGKRWGRGFMKRAAEQTGGYVTHINPDEPVNWRSFELLATLNTSRLLNVQVVDEAERCRFLTFASTAAQGEEIAAVARLAGDEAMPTAVVVHGVLDGEPVREVLRVQDAAPRADHLPRTWAKLEIDRLLADSTKEHKDAIIALSKAMYVMTPYTSLLVLENDDMYRQFKVDRGRKDHWAMYPCPAKIDVVYEPDPSQPPLPAAATALPNRDQVLNTLAVRVPPVILNWPDQPAGAGGQTMTAWQLLQSPTAPDGSSAAHRNARQTRDLGDVVEAGDPLARSSTQLGRLTSLDDLLPQVESLEILGERDFNRDQRRENIIAGQPVHRSGAGDWPWFVSTNFAADTRRNLNGIVFSPDGKQLASLLAWKGRVQDSLAEGLQPLVEFRLWDAVTADPGVPDNKLRSSYVLQSLTGRLARGESAAPRLYGRPSFSGDERVFSDLVAYAPGLNTTLADVQTVLEAEAAPQLGALSGQIDPAARRLIEQARRSGWFRLDMPAERLSLTFDGHGRYVAEEVLPLGLKQLKVCDGRALWHLYPELGIGARRVVSRFHRAALQSMVPWALPPVEDLARGADVRCVDERTVALVPRLAESARDEKGEPVLYHVLHLRFGEDGRLVERQLVAKPSGKVVARELYPELGIVKSFDGAGKETRSLKRVVAPAGPPNLEPDTSKLVVLPLPLRTREHVYAQRGLNPAQALDHPDNGCYEYLSDHQTLELFTAEFAAHNTAEAVRVFRTCFAKRGSAPIGFQVLLSACGANVASEPAFRQAWDAFRREPVGRYLALQASASYRAVQQRWDANLGDRVAPPDSFLDRLARFRDLYLRWQDHPDRLTHGTLGAARQERALDFVKRNRSTVLGLALLCLLQDRANDTALHQSLANTWDDFAKHSRLGYLARYEQARSLFRAGQRQEARKRFRELYNQAFKDGELPRVDATFRIALLGDEQEEDQWDGLMRHTAMELTKERRPIVVALAWQCWQLGDQPLAARLLNLALEGTATDDERIPVTLAAIEYWWQTGQLPRADSVLRSLLDNEKFQDQPALWRLGTRLAQERGMTDRSLACLEKALNLEYQHLPEVIDLQAVRTDYGRLLSHYESLAGRSEGVMAGGAAGMPGASAPPGSGMGMMGGGSAGGGEGLPDLLARTVQAADRWRALDRDTNTPAEAAATVARILGDEDLAWDYLSTPLASPPRDSSAWLGLAERLHREGHTLLADRAYAAACAADPGNASLLWQRIENLRQARLTGHIEPLLRQLAEGNWGPEYRGLRLQAQRLLEGR